VRATRAYIASLGTTGVLIASSLLLLALVSAIVAFRGWPELEAAEGSPPGMLVDQDRAPVPVATLEVDGEARRLTRSAEARGQSSDRGSRAGDGESDPGGTNRNGIAPEHGGSSPQGDQGGGRPGDPTAGVRDSVPSVPTVGGTLPDGTTDNVRKGLSDTTEDTVNNLGNTLNGVDPNLGSPLSGTGTEVGNTLEESIPESGSAPLPGVDVKLP
jgi:hypothetical protein